MVDPLTLTLIGAGIPAIGSMFSTIFNSSAQSDLNAQQMRFNAAEASKNREFQGQQLNQAQQYNTQEAEKARQYNTWLLSHSTQRNVQDARSAGLNPAFMNGSVLGSTPSPSVAASSAGAPGSQASVGSLGISPLRST